MVKKQKGTGIATAMIFGIFFLAFIALPASAQTAPCPNSAAHCAIVTWQTNPQPAGEAIVNTNVIRDGTQLASVPLPTLTYPDVAVNAGETHTYALANVDSKGKASSLFIFAPVTIPGGVVPPPPPVTYKLQSSITSFGLSAVSGAAIPNLTFSVSDTSPSIIVFSLATSVPWLNVATTAPNDQGINVNAIAVKSTGLPLGVNNGVITISAANQFGYAFTPLSIPVSVTITAPLTPKATCTVKSTNSTSMTLTVVISNYPAGAGQFTESCTETR